MIVTGRNVAFEAIKAGKANKIYVRHGASVHFENISIPFEVLGRSVFEERFGFETQGVAVDIDDFVYAEYKEFISSLVSAKGVIILDKIQDPHNFGAIIRASHCFGINKIIVPRHDQAKVTASVFKASSGSIFYADILEAVNLKDPIIDMKEMGYSIISADMDGDISLKDYAKKEIKNIGLIIGSEGKGVRESIKQLSDNVIFIPMDSQIDSLNASMSTAIICYGLWSKS